MVENDQLSLLMSYIKVVIKEAYLHRMKVAVGFSVVSLVVLVAGLFYPSSFSTSVTLFADKSNIIAPLLHGQAAVTRVNEQSRIVKETIYSPRLLRKVIEKVTPPGDIESSAELERRINQLRSDITIKSLGSSYIKIEYSSPRPRDAYKTINAVVDEFVRDSSESQKAESRSAYEFIDNQVVAYREQLQEAEERLKNFKASSDDGNEAIVERRLTQLRASIETMDLDIEDIRTRVSSLQQELNREDKYANKRYKADIYRENLRQAQQHMDSLLLNFTADHPDVISLRYKIDDLKQQIINAESDSTSDEDKSNETSLNPLYEVLREKIADANVELKSKLKRRASTIRLMEEERNRLQRVAANQAQLAELTRDYNVTKNIYEEMLDRKEKARLSMTLDIEGKGVNYKIQEPAIYPLTPTGLRFAYFFFAGPFVGVLIPLGLLVAYVVFDPRIRFSNQLSNEMDIPSLGAIPHMNTPLGSRMLRRDAIAIGSLLLAVLTAYAVTAAIKLLGAN